MNKPKVNWAVDTYILESRGVTGDLLAAIRNQGFGLHTTKYVPFQEDQDYGTFDYHSEAVILYGTHGYVSKCRLPVSPGAFGLGMNLNCDRYYPKLPSEWLLNSDYIILPFKEVQKNHSRIFNLFDDAHFFMRPVSGFKTFTGLVLDTDNIDRELSSSMQLTSVQEETLVLLSSAKDLKAEFRFLIGANEVIDGSEYRWDNVLDIRHDYDIDCLNLAKKVAVHSWQPDLVYTCDVALTDNGPKIVELNSFACAGLYAMDKELVVNRVSEIAANEFVGMYD